MKHCEDCIHDEVCGMWAVDSGIPFVNADTCVHYKAKSDVIELPCIAMVEQFITGGKFDKKHTAHNGRTAVVYVDKSKWNSPLIDITEEFYGTARAEERIQALKDMQRGDKDGE